MNPELKLSLIAVIGVALIVLVLTLVQRPSQNVPATNTPVKANVNTNVAVSPVSTTPTPAPEPTMTAQEQKVAQDVLQSSPQFTVSPGDCNNILETEPWCSVVQDVRQITCPEWEELFPQAKFFLVKRNVVGQESGFRQNLLITEQAGQQYGADTFDHLLNLNGIVITDSNRELVIKAFVLTTLTDYLEQDIAFSNWTQGDWPGRLGRRFTYSLTVWTKIQGLRMKWFFAFENNRLWLARRLLEIDYHIGDYIDVPFEVLPLPGSTEHLFRGQ